MKVHVQTRYAQILIRCLVFLSCAAILLPANPQVLARAAHRSVDDQAVKIPPEQLDSLVAPIALYPDNMLSQTSGGFNLPAGDHSTTQWLERNPDLAKDQKKLADAVKKQPWDPSIQAMAALPDVVKRLSDDIQWTTDLGNAFLAQQKDVMDRFSACATRRRTPGAGVKPATEGGDTDDRKQRSDCDPTVKSGSGVRAFLQPDCCLWRAVSVSAYLLSTFYGAVIAASAISFGSRHGPWALRGAVAGVGVPAGVAVTLTST